ncbi:MAG: hypothetical protein LC122_10760, partial [Chitinophagales bacterium]|nr:hypothetical protein [Chitinophagales bacterium]
IVILFVEKIEKIKNVFIDCNSLSYYDFIDKCRDTEFLNDRNFYTEKIPRYLGAYFFVIKERAIKDFATKQMVKENLHIDKFSSETKMMFHTFQVIHNKILYDLKSVNSFNQGYAWELKCFREWWFTF